MSITRTKETRDALLRPFAQYILDAIKLGYEGEGHKHTMTFENIERLMQGEDEDLWAELYDTVARLPIGEQAEIAGYGPGSKDDWEKDDEVLWEGMIPMETIVPFTTNLDNSLRGESYIVLVATATMVSYLYMMLNPATKPAN